MSILWGTSAALAAPDAGSLQQEIVRERELAPAARSAVRDIKPAVPEKPLSGQRFTVREFVFEGNTLLTSEQLSQALAPCLGREVDFDRLKACAALVTEAYQSAGWVAKAVLPPQDILEGKVAIKVIEARFGNYIFTGSRAPRIGQAQLQGIFDAHQKSGELLNMARLDRGLLLADDLPGVSVSGNLDQGAQDGSTSLVVQVGEEPWVSGNASVDNYGSISTGVYRFNASLNANSPLKVGDLLSFNVMASEGNRYLRVEQSFPLGHQGLRVGLNASSLSYKLTSAQYAALDAKGSASTLGISASYPLIRARDKNLNLTLNVDRKNYANTSAGTSVSDYLINTWAVAVDGNSFDEWIGGGATFASASVSGGNKDLSGSANQVSDALTANTQGNFNKLRYLLSRQQKIDDNWSVFMNYSGQLTRRNLDSSESFYLGGNAGVRAYPTNEGRGSSGQLATLELRARMDGGFTWIGFYDWGRVLGYPHNNFPGATEPNVTVLQGYGTAVIWQAGKGGTIKASWARRVGSNPTPTGKDQDGTLVRNRLWLNASLPF
ncbi:MAG: ShlB/FhaC/HecB family hemolysin secretion/activation protein [Betaproteobacteria bacterium]